MRGLIFDIKRFSINDGPGIRTTVFFKGCPLRCSWCHNPESQSKEVECYSRNVKVGEGIFETEQKVGKWYTVEEIFAEIIPDRQFYDQSGGGVTFSGGEPLMQAGFLKRILEKCKENGIHTAVDTSGYAPVKILDEIASLANLFLYDLKIINNDHHIKYTGVSNELIISNLKRLIGWRKDIVIRFPVIPGITMDDQKISDLSVLLKDLAGDINNISLLPYHPLAKNKYSKMYNSQEFDELPEVSAESLFLLEQKFSAIGYKVNIGF